jgi:hypothetical protein
MARVRPKENFNLFEVPKPPEPERTVEPPPTPPKIDNPCPRCHGRSAESKRERGKFYCLGGCLSEDKTDCFYFVPIAEEPEREAAREAVASEPVEVETEALPEGHQQALIETGEKWEVEWRGMPEFVQEDLAPWKSIYVHFERREDMQKFAKLVKQTITLNTRSIWYPEAEIGRMATKKYVEGPVDRKTASDDLR